MPKFLVSLFVILGFFAVTGCKEAEVGSKQRPFMMYFVPSVDAQKVSEPAEEMTRFVSKFVSNVLYGKEDGFFVKSAVPSSYIAVVEAFGTKKADFAAFNTFSYILAKDIKKYDVEAALTVVREGGEKTYKAQIITRADSGINSIDDLKGKKFAFSDPSSTSGYFLPAKLFKDKGIELGDTVFAQKHDNVVTMVYQKQVDAGATFYSPPIEVEENGVKIRKLRDARVRVRPQFPDVEEKVKIIGFSDAIPNEPWVLRGKLVEDIEKNNKMKQAVLDGIQAYVKTPEGNKAMKDLYDLSELVRVTDQDYDGIRKIVLESKVDVQKLVIQK